MHIELISRAPTSGASERLPLLFVHGAMHGAWCWDEYFLPWFAARGWEAHALSLRGHSGSDGADRLKHWRVRDYVEDVLSVVDGLPRLPVLIGHSMGGSIAAKVAALREIPGLVLFDTAPLSPLPPEFRGRLLKDHRIRVILAGLTGDLRIAHPAFGKAFFSATMPAAEKKRHLRRLGGESELALADTVEGKDPPDFTAVRAPSLVISASDDQGIGIKEHAQIATLINGRHVICAGSHDLMLDVGWEATAQVIADWLNTAVRREGPEEPVSGPAAQPKGFI